MGTLGVLLFSITWTVTAVVLWRTADSAERFPVWRFLLAELSMVGVFVSAEADWWLYPVFTVLWTLIAFVVAFQWQSTCGWRHVWVSATAAFVGFGLASLVYAFQPAPPLAALWVVVPGLISLVPPVNLRLRRLFAGWRTKVQKSTLPGEEFAAAKAKREEWLARR